MKNLISTFLLVSLLSSSCVKEQVAQPAAHSPSTAGSTAPISLKNANINIYSFKAEAADNKIEVGFLTLFQKDIKTLEILKGTTPNSLCSIYKTDVLENTTATIKYETEDSNTADAPVLYYIVKYTLQNNDWGYTPLFVLKP